MKKMRMSLMGLLAAILLVGSGMSQEASGQVRVKATVHAPQVDIQLGNVGSRYHRRNATVSSPVGSRKISELDRQIARRLGRFAGVSPQKLLQLKRRGYHWFEIGTWLQLPGRAVRAAMNERSWQRFVSKNQYARCIIEPREMRRVAYYDQFED